MNLKKGVASLTSIRSVVSGLFRKTVDTDRPVIDRTYSFGLTVVFKDKAGHDEYQTDPVHLEFVRNCSGMWSRVLIYDFE